ncbi:hypothetical protein [Nocardia sp. NPDC051832]|uniref:hypothetical protein n=1 Tax=Nocardia sp. NPDC051832 TaxID=3155673 RepID=UPI00343BE6FE
MQVVEPHHDRVLGFGQARVSHQFTQAIPGRDQYSGGRVVHADRLEYGACLTDFRRSDHQDQPWGCQRRRQPGVDLIARSRYIRVGPPVIVGIAARGRGGSQQVRVDLIDPGEIVAPEHRNELV